MKRNMKFFAIVLSLLLLSSVILAGCMYAIAADNGEVKPYDRDGQKENGDSPGGNIVEGEAPFAQTELQKKFGAYLHKDGNTVTVFSEEQYSGLKDVRESDKRIPLTYEEILYLVNDSINLYFTYEEIRLTNSNRDNVVPLLSDRSENARIITPAYKDASAYETYDEAITAYQQMLADIYEIIFYRIYMHDAGFEGVFHHYHSGQDLIFGRRYHTSPISSAAQVEHYQMLAIDNAAFSGIENEEKLVGEYKTLLEWKRICEMDVLIDYAQYPYLNSAVLYTSILNAVGQPMEYKFYIAGPKDGWPSQIYPTAELEDMMPHREFIYEVSASDDQMQPGFALNYENGTVAMGAGIYLSFAMNGAFEEHDGVLKMYFKEYSYVFYKHENGYVYSAGSSKPAKSGGFDFADGLVFEKIHEGVSKTPNSSADKNEAPPSHVADDDKTETRMPYFKQDAASTICTLMTPDGVTYADGTYVQEGDTRILYFRDEFRYVFYYREAVGYEYAKGESDPVPGYEFEDGTIFSFDGVFLTVDQDEK